MGVATAIIALGIVVTTAEFEKALPAGMNVVEGTKVGDEDLERGESRETKPGVGEVEDARDGLSEKKAADDAK
ncbi:hypothetical protein NEMBOFW57_005493 [Staphylotrichum longicolle]|uniref:Uncharacterized protein n=1 Tax=Staphylotrichum longicolle TaxID=669026 RepID=A0AAD4EXU1_9PEZI|nr:hypothetical protein NEMBOFW57_005493 [Staphylotrichum longicolle]